MYVSVRPNDRDQLASKFNICIKITVSHHQKYTIPAEIKQLDRILQYLLNRSGYIHKESYWNLQGVLTKRALEVENAEYVTNSTNARHQPEMRGRSQTEHNQLRKPISTYWITWVNRFDNTQRVPDQIEFYMHIQPTMLLQRQSLLRNTKLRLKTTKYLIR